MAGFRADGYGGFWLNGKSHPAHRISWEFTNGAIPGGKKILHTCDNPPCVNPSHLFVGTHADNVADRVSKGRSAVGERNGRSKLNEDEVKKIKTSSLKNRELAKIYSVDPRTIYGIKNSLTWKHI